MTSARRASQLRGPRRKVCGAWSERDGGRPEVHVTEARRRWPPGRSTRLLLWLALKDRVAWRSLLVVRPSAGVRVGQTKPVANDASVVVADGRSGSVAP